MTAVTLTVTVELNTELTEDELSSFQSDLVFGFQNAANREIGNSLLAAARRNHGGLNADVHISVNE